MYIIRIAIAFLLLFPIYAGEVPSLEASFNDYLKSRSQDSWFPILSSVQVTRSNEKTAKGYLKKTKSIYDWAENNLHSDELTMKNDLYLLLLRETPTTTKASSDEKLEIYKGLADIFTPYMKKLNSQISLNRLQPAVNDSGIDASKPNGTPNTDKQEKMNKEIYAQRALREMHEQISPLYESVVSKIKTTDLSKDQSDTVSKAKEIDKFLTAEKETDRRLLKEAIFVRDLKN